MPSHAYFEELPVAVLMDAEEEKGLLQQSPEEVQALVERMHDHILSGLLIFLEPGEEP